MSVRYTIDYGTGITDPGYDSLEDAKRAAEDLGCELVLDKYYGIRAYLVTPTGDEEE